MNVRIWAEQSDLFEIGVLEQNAETSAGTLEELSTDTTGVVVLVGRALSSERLGEIRSLVLAVFKSGRKLVIVPPYGDLDVGRYLDSPVGVRLLRRASDSVVNVVEEGLRLRLGGALSVRSDHVIETAFGTGLLATDGSGKPVALRYQPRNTSGAAIVCTAQLLSYTALSTEEDRQALLTALLLCHTDMSTPRAELSHDANAESVDAGHVATMLIALAASQSVDPGRLRQLSEAYLDLALDASTTECVLAHLEGEGVLCTGSEGERRILDEALEAALGELGLHACARELREIVREHREVPR